MTMNNYDQEQEQDQDQDLDRDGGQDDLVQDGQEGREGRLLSSLLDGVEIATGHIQRAPEGEPGNTETETETETKDIPGITPPSALVADPEAPTPCSFLTGIAGSGKTYQLRERCSSDPMYAALSSSTGISAVNLSTITVHSLLGFFDTDSLRDAYIQGGVQRRIRKLVGEGYRNVAIDECSMISKETLDLLVRAFDDVNTGLIGEGRSPIGLILTGDFCQLSPIADRPQGYHPTPGRRRSAPPVPWAFESQFWSRFAANETKLTKIWRQVDQRFLAALNFARAGRGRDCVQVLQSCGQRFESFVDNDFDGTTIVGKNDEVDRINQIRLDRVKGRLIALPSRRWAVGGKVRPEWKHLPERTLLRENCYVMILANKYEEGRMVYANGDCGWVKGIQPSIDKLCPPSVLVELVRTGEVVNVESLVRGIEHGEKPDWVGGGVEWQEQGAGEDGKFLPQPHWRKSKKRYVTGQVEYYPLRVAYASTVHKCVAGDTRIPVIGRGWITADSVKVDDYTPFGKILGTAVSVKRAYRITTHRGYEMVCSSDHRWMTRLGLKETANLNIGDSIELVAMPPLAGSTTISSEFAWWLGALIGDGSSTDKREGQLHFACQTAPELGNRYIAFLQSQGLRASWRKDNRGVHSTSKPFRQYLETLGIDYSKGPDKKIPKGIWEAGSAAWGPFLQGLFDTDGSVGKSFIVYCTRSEQLGKDVQMLLLGLGILSKRRRWLTGRSPIEIKRLGIDDGKRVPYWQVFIPAFQLDRFRTYIGFSRINKREKLERTHPNRSIVRSDGYDEVVYIESLDIDIPMYDFETTSPNLLPFGPFIGHNCQGLSLDKVQVDIRGWQFKSTAAMTYVALSRARTLQGLRLVGTPELLAERCKVDPKVARWL